MKKFITFILIVLCSFAFADTGDWEGYERLVANQGGGTLDMKTNKLFASYVNTAGIHVWYIDYPSYIRYRSYDFDGTLIESNQNPVDYEEYTEIDMDGNDEALFTVWTDVDFYDGRWQLLLHARVSTDNGETWSTKLTLTIPSYTGILEFQYLRGLHVNCDEDGVHITTSGNLVIGGATHYKTIYAYLPNDSDSDNDWVYDIDVIPASSSGEWTSNDCVIEAINDFGSSNYDNIMISYVPMSRVNFKGSISTDGGETFTNVDIIDEKTFHPCISMDLAEGGSYMDGEDEYRYFFAFWATHESFGNDTIFYSYRAAKGSSGYSGTWSTPSYFLNEYTSGVPAGLMDVNTNGSGEYGSVDLVYPYIDWPSGSGSLKYRNVSTSGFGDVETIDDVPRYFPDVTKNGNDIYVLYRTTFEGSTGDIRFKYRDGVPVTPAITKSWSGDNPRITWEKPCLDVEEYNVYRKINYGSWTIRTTTSNLYYIDTHYQEDRRGANTLKYRVVAVDYDNNLSGNSNEVTYIGMEEVAKSIGDFHPTEYALHNAYPNPFNPTTTITFDIPESGYANLSVYNSVGQKVIDLINGNVEAGRHQVQLDGANLSSGVYIITMVSSNFSENQKIILLK